MTTYPYYLVISREGRLPCPIQYKHTPIEKMFISGKIGGTRTEERHFTDPSLAQEYGFSQERLGKTVEVCRIAAPNSYRQVCNDWRGRFWAVEIKNSTMDIAK